MVSARRRRGGSPIGRDRAPNGPEETEQHVAQAGTTSSRGGLTGRYATALYDLAAERHGLDEVVDQMAGLGRLIDESADLRRAPRAARWWM